MLLRITEKCHGKCSHCMINASPEGEHMSMDTFYKSLEFIERQDPLCLIISGGEPTEHPNVCEMVNAAKRSGRMDVTLVSNGHFLFNQALTEKILELGVKVQITYDKRFYKVPLDVDSIKHPLLLVETHIRHIFPQGRAVTNNIKSNSLAPKCFNLRSIARNNVSSLKEAIKLLEVYMKFCTPSINIDGGISAGESNACYRIGDITMNDELLYKNLVNMKCNKCNQENLLSDFHKKAIGS